MDLDKTGTETIRKSGPMPREETGQPAPNPNRPTAPKGTLRARRGCLTPPGAPDLTAAARAILGAQSQQLPPSLLALSLRTAGRPSAEQVRRRLFGGQRDLARTWGQRETLHVYDAATDWPLVAAARAQWAPAGRRGVVPSTQLVDRALKVLHFQRRY